ncbi:unnamed protein product [Periconia digitata]|uniref:Uncharacterized protein n=1 Tax=Periconia digitata TaxID=1303443 RepID=A0A9W4XL58_9PLEO|nr:unnamed protein product [Periconia digitata]
MGMDGLCGLVAEPPRCVAFFRRCCWCCATFLWTGKIRVERSRCVWLQYIYLDPAVLVRVFFHQHGFKRGKTTLLGSSLIDIYSENPTTSVPIPNPQRSSDDDNLKDIAGNDNMRLSQSPEDTADRRESREWDASKVPPSQFQRRKGSIYSTPGSRDGHVKGSDRDQAYWQKLKEKVCPSPVVLVRVR